ncbi:MAG TPA: hypothetical protein VMW41_04325 [Candidatus Bathyarchaeia archaeon]|nr:hypothetical protein [Candidatus Bathyarchaeia archaeon]
MIYKKKEEGWYRLETLCGESHTSLLWLTSLVSYFLCPGYWDDWPTGGA